MGQQLVLGGPVTVKDSSDGHCQGVTWAVSGMQGWRESMEDAHLIVPKLEGKGWNEWAAFGVMDGHGGEYVARFCERHFAKQITKGSSGDVEGSLISAFHRLDEMLTEPAHSDELRRLSSKSWFATPDSMNCGCTALVCCVKQDVVVVANAGDCRAVLCREGKAIDMSEDHKPNLPSERERITRAGGVVEVIHFGPMTQYRVNGNLNLSRAIGDLSFKQTDLSPKEQMVCATPDVRTFQLDPRDEFMVIACDGVWDVMSSQEVCDFLRPRLGHVSRTSSQVAPSKLLESLLDRCLSPDLMETRGLGGDNMTIMLIVFDRGDLYAGNEHNSMSCDSCNDAQKPESCAVS